MFAQFPGKVGAALAAVVLTLGLAGGTSRAAELEDFSGSWEVQLTVVAQVGEVRQAIAEMPGTLELAESGVTMEGTLTAQTGGQEVRIPLQGATIGEERLSFHLSTGQPAGDAAFDEAIGRLFSEFGLDVRNTPIALVGWFEVSDLHLTGEIDVEGFSIPGVADAVQLIITGTKPSGPGVPDQLAEEAFEPEAPAVEEFDDEDTAPIHGGADADVAALSEAELADAQASVQMSAARAIAEQERKRRERMEALRRIERVHAYEYELVGDNAEAVLEEGSLRALTTTAARLYYGNYVLVGRDLLEPYLRANGGEFLLERRVLGQQGTPDGRRRVRVRVVVDTDRLYDDLDSKHFITEPKFRPVMTVALEERLNDAPTPIPIGRATVEELLEQVDMRVEELPLAGGMDAVDATSDPDLMRQARAEAERLEGDVLVTGTARLYGPASRVILFDQFYEVSGDLWLQFIRVDNGQVLRTYSGTYTATADTAEGAIRRCFFRMASAAVVDMTEGFIEEWQSTMLDRSDYRICITGATPQQVDVFQSHLISLSPEARTFVKSQFANVAVLNVNLPGTPREQLESFLHRHRTPQFKVIPNGPGRYELRVL